MESESERQALRRQTDIEQYSIWPVDAPSRQNRGGYLPYRIASIAFLRMAGTVPAHPPFALGHISKSGIL